MWGLSGCSNPSQDNPSQFQVDTDIFYHVREQLEDNNVPLRLPRWLPPGNEQIREAGLVAQLIEGDTVDSKNRYRLVIAEPNCGDRTPCRYATISAYPVDETPRSLSEEMSQFWRSPEFEPTERAPSPPQKVELKGDRIGYFFPWFVGAYLTEAQVRWQEAGYRYRVGAKGASKDEVIKMANSALP